MVLKLSGVYIRNQPAISSIGVFWKGVVSWITEPRRVVDSHITWMKSPTSRERVHIQTSECVCSERGPDSLL